MEVTNKYITIKAQIDGAPQESDFELKTEPLSLMVKPGSKDVIIKNLYLSMKPYTINRMKTINVSRKYSDIVLQISLGEVVDAYGLGRVISSGNPEFEKGDYVVGFLGWAEYTISKGITLRKLDPVGLPLSYHVGLLGLSGLTAYVGFFEICKPKKGEKVFVSTACGSVGNLVSQYAKSCGCFVVGCAGSPKKVKILKEQLGIDEAFNYKEEIDINSTLQSYFPNGIDIYFDNVGGQILEAAISNMNLYGRVSICGVISEYTGAGKPRAPDMLNVIHKRVTIKGFLAMDYMSLFPEFVSTTIDLICTRKLHVLEDVSVGLESVPSAFVGLFRRYNVGKRIVQVCDD